MSNGTKRPIDSGRKSVTGATVKISGNQASNVVTAPPPSVTEDDLHWYGNVETWTALTNELPELTVTPSYVVIQVDPDGTDYTVHDGDGPVEVFKIDGPDYMEGEDACEHVENACKEAITIADPAARQSYLATVEANAAEDDTGEATRIVEACKQAPVRQVVRSNEAEFAGAVQAANAVNLYLVGIGDDHDGHPTLSWIAPTGERVTSRCVDEGDSHSIEFLGSETDGDWSEDWSDFDIYDDDDALSDALPTAHFQAYWSVKDRTESNIGHVRSDIVANVQPAWSWD